MAFRTLASSFCLVLVSGCSGPASGDAGGDDAGRLLDAGGTDAGPPDVDAGPPASFGRINIGVPGFVTAKFYRDGVYYEPTGGACTIEFEGPCVILLCGAGAPAANVTAGTIQFTGLEGVSITLTPDLMGVYPRAPSSFETGQQIEVAAAGDFVPGFTTTVTVPSTPSVTPVVSATIVRADGAMVTWTPTTGTLRVAVTLVAGSEVACTVDGSAGAVTIPASVLGRLEAGAARVSAFPVDITRVMPAGNVVDVQAAFVDASTSRDVTLQ